MSCSCAEPAWASFSEGGTGSKTGHLSHDDSQQQHSRGGKQQEAVPVQSLQAAPAPDAHQHSPPIDIPMSHGSHSPPDDATETNEFSSFNYWRSPPAMLVDDVDIAADSPRADSSTDSPCESPEGNDDSLLKTPAAGSHAAQL